MSNMFMDSESRVAIAKRVAERRRAESWNEVTIPDGYDRPLDKAEYQTRAAKWLWHLYII
ncbi:MAG: hypothetical protein WCD13_20330 [Pseudolabrys sp.]